jgi:hypothetical protein
VCNPASMARDRTKDSELIVGKAKRKERVLSSSSGFRRALAGPALM